MRFFSMQERKSGCARLSACPMERFRNRAVTKLVPLLHHEPPALLAVKFRHGIRPPSHWAPQRSRGIARAS
jgi:hypothetical protein